MEHEQHGDFPFLSTSSSEFTPKYYRCVTGGLFPNDVYIEYTSEGENR